ncbi:4-hydroxythreonine-4-phosphate dehydrogenase PdxA [Acidovorax sp. HMWF018]|uniref:4-hydroxythreonine-4-phosphate dehydrogenase PdxA n=1 Tax=Acidovorax sp. HMWF018 TaxID=2056855 RepID=UPI000D342515|nr:4-hydroxythreonine-4-phosphate dehydrogenase PdxA [Acidovorax sp. HMWF018]PTT43309.1 4-hydroxythreonine-4-phosphate dehydrogenase PdxA [Acidovorax sp. HMWF018]
MQPIAITQGDPAGIGPEIVVKAFRDATDALRHCFVVGDLATVRRAADAITRPGVPGVPVAQIGSPGEAGDAPPRCIPVLQLPGIPGPQPWGEISAAAGRAAADSVVWAARAALRGEVAALVTAPLHKEALSAAGVDFPGHTELLQAEAAAHQGVPLARMPVRMMLANDELRTVLVSIHVSLLDAIAAVTQDNVLQTLQITHAALQRSLGRVPRMGVAGLNPHAGEGGLFGREELEVIAPAIAAARAQGLDVHGPFAPDTVFMRARSTPQRAGEFDVVIAMYHDQGLIPVKYLGVEKGVNVTLGLPLVRTSPDHGTAFDIAGQGVADASSLIEAVRMARALCG